MILYEHKHELKKDVNDVTANFVFRKERLFTLLFWYYLIQQSSVERSVSIYFSQ